MQKTPPVPPRTAYGPNQALAPNANWARMKPARGLHALAADLHPREGRVSLRLRHLAVLASRSRPVAAVPQLWRRSHYYSEGARRSAPFHGRQTRLDKKPVNTLNGHLGRVPSAPQGEVARARPAQEAPVAPMRRREAERAIRLSDRPRPQARAALPQPDHVLRQAWRS